MKRVLLLVGIVAALMLAVSCETTGDQMESEMESDMSSDMDPEESGEMDAAMGQEYLVTIEVVQGSVTPIAPVAWAVHTGANPFLGGGMGEKLSGLESLAEDGNPAPANDALAGVMEVKQHGVANTPEASGSPGPATPGSSYEFTVTAGEGAKLSFATMYVQSNDLFFSPGEMGLSLSGEMAATGDVTDQIHLYDAGTEVNQEPGSGSDQAPRQMDPDTGASEEKPVMQVDPMMADFAYPAVAEVIKVTVEHVGM